MSNFNEYRMIGIDIGGTNFRIGAVSRDGDIEDFRKIPVREVFATSDPLSDLGAYLQDYIDMQNKKNIGIAGVSIGFPATLDRDRKTVLQAPNISFMENLPVVEVLGKKLQIPVYIERDVTIALYYDIRKFHIPDCQIISGIYFGTGIGNALFINGHPLAGKNGAAGELGHIPVDGSDVVCGCGNVGCMESLAGGKYLAELCEKIYAETPIGDIFSRQGSDKLLIQFIDRMAIAVATEINILDPDYVLIGGGVPSMKDFPQDLLTERVLFHTRKPYPADALDIIYTGDRPEKCVIGAALYGFSCCKEPTL